MKSSPTASPLHNDSPDRPCPQFEDFKQTLAQLGASTDNIPPLPQSSACEVTEEPKVEPEEPEPVEEKDFIETDMNELAEMIESAGAE